MTEFLERARAFSHQRQQLGKQAHSAEQALHNIIAVYSAHPSAPLSLYARTKTVGLAVPLDERRIRCVACGHRCPLPDGAAGVCKVRGNRGGELYVPWGYVAGVQCDPIEKKPFFHVSPGALAYSFGMLGCDLHCGYCQNWVTSQALRDPGAVSPPRQVTPEALVSEAVALGARAIEHLLRWQYS